MQSCIMLMVLLFPFTCFAQKDSIFYNENKRVKTLEEATSYRLPYIAEGDVWKIQEYYASGQLLSEGYTRSPDTLIWDGPFNSYYSNGHKRAEGKYLNGYQVGAWKTYYEDTERLWVLTTFNLLSDTTSILRSFYPSGKVKRIEYHVKNSKEAGVCFSENGETIPFTPYQQPPAFKGELNRFLAINIRYPEEAREAFADGNVQVVFTVTETGESEGIGYISNFLHPSLNAEAVRVITQSSGLWIPAMLDDIPYASVHTLPVRFRIE